MKFFDLPLKRQNKRNLQHIEKKPQTGRGMEGKGKKKEGKWKRKGRDERTRKGKKRRASNQEKETTEQGCGAG